MNCQKGTKEIKRSYIKFLKFIGSLIKKEIKMKIIEHISPVITLNN